MTLNVHLIPLGVWAGYMAITMQQHAKIKYGARKADSSTAAAKRPVADCEASTVITQPVTAAATPRFADCVNLAAASARAEMAVIGASQPNARPAAVLDAAAAARARAVLTANTASARTSNTIPSPTAMLRESSQATSTPGPYA